MDVQPKGRAAPRAPGKVRHQIFDLPRLNAWRMTRPGTPSRVIADCACERVNALLESKRDRRARSLSRTRRSRKTKDKETTAALVDMLVANLVRAHLLYPLAATCAATNPYMTGPNSEYVFAGEGGGGWLGQSLSQRNLLPSKERYRRRPMSVRSLPDVIDAMHQDGLLFLFKAPAGAKVRRPSYVRAGHALLDLIQTLHPTLADLSMRNGAEGIWLREARPRRAAHKLHWANGTLIDYRDDTRTNGMRRQLEVINTWWARADISFDPSVVPKPPASISLHERFAWRIFNNGSFEEGGRLAGPFWMGMKRKHRLGLRLAGEPCVLLDFSSMFLMLLYAVMAKVQPPLHEDLYEFIVGADGTAGSSWPEDSAEREQLRRAIKTNVSSLLFREPGSKPRRRVTAGTSEVLKRYSLKLKGIELDRRIRERHPAIANFLRGSSIGFHLMYLESQILMSILLMCREQNIMALSLHDGLLVAKNDASMAKSIMEICFFKATGRYARVNGPHGADGEMGTMQPVDEMAGDGSEG